jgi:hypothetical protein
MPDEGEALPGDMDAAFDKAFDEAPSVAPATTVPDTPAPKADAPAPSTGRNEKGQFTKAEPTEALPPEATPDAQSDAPPAEDALETPPEAVEDAATHPEFTYRSAGREFNIPGSAVGEDGAFIPTPALPAITRLLAEGQHAKEASREYAARLQEARAEGQKELQYARSLLASLNNLRQQGPEAIAQWFDDLDLNWPLMEANAKLSLMEKEREAEKAKLTEATREREAEALVPQLKGVLTEKLEEYAKRPEFAGIDQKRLFNRLSGRLFDQVFEEATEDDVAQGIAQRVGQVVVNWGVIEDEVKDEADLLRRARESAKLTREVAKQNAASTAESKAPPTVGAKKGASVATGKPVPKFKSRAEADAWFDEDGFNSI